jgi:prepilin-type N-terminal cleavage/methylation domain-containing protein/prepilin-type processing-associated H-X9-DG protein
MLRRAFTLIELLVVVAIIALLTSILMPALGRAREASKATVCLSNMRELGLAILMYADRYNGHLITAGMPHGGNVDENAAWINTLQKDYQNSLVARCPCDKSIYWQIPVPPANVYRRASYALNYYLDPKIPLTNRGPYDRQDVIRWPSSTIILVELVEHTEDPTASSDYAASDHVHPEEWWSDPDRKAAQQVYLKRHIDKANYLFVDGHVSPFKFKQTYEIDPTGGFPPKFLQNKYDPDIAR